MGHRDTGVEKLQPVEEARRLRIEVHDHDYSGRGLTPREPGPDDEGGRGLVLVGQLADSWGVDRSRLTSGNAVWATLSA
ncbi:ATP-binding protein [Streptomyces griseoluteus]|uniref:ATP-binding protein n=1 Tax=Streptomyces griseoluteus TaxID=29306 RepID=UPI00382FE6DF